MSHILHRKNILILSEGFGTGHTQAAYAISEGLKNQSTQIHTKVIELGSSLHPYLAPHFFNVYRKTLNVQPKIYAKLYYSKYKNSPGPITQMILHRVFYAKTTQLIHQFNPDIILCTHPFPNAVIARLKRLGLSIPLYTIVTDYDIHGAWMTTETDKYLIPTEEIKQKLMNKNIPEKKIIVSGIPVHPKFWKKSEKKLIREKFQLKNKPTLLVMGGGWGMLNYSQLLEYLLSWKEKIQIIICMGNNDKARKKMDTDPLFQHENIHVLGFTKNVDELMDASDLLITKPGGVTCTEGLVKGLPMLFYNPIPGHEENNCQFFLNHQLAKKLTSIDELKFWLDQLVKHEKVQFTSKPLSRYKYSVDIIDCLV
ncbi:MGDG synthase family glycosyltransferase [Chengkuizengella axinellae]|uniref:Glycosyltransferase n=1 Tax=Chengkuizengella axinellae TaxID=3064388 RepID=A0ABT9J3N3_9BACL|nr:glycosyltransferase [Chengkuizengella sp. 2205SS18-9]MDP5276237.1 glycosyltransferase [Chengkuizengella sp. 2205SS18-9]